MERDLVPGFEPRVPPHTGPARHPHMPHHARDGQEIVEGILRRDAALDRVAARRQRAGVHPQGLSRRHAQLLPHDVHPVHQLGHRVLDLETGVHFQEIELAAWREQKLDRAGAEIADRSGGGGGGVAQPAPQRGRHGERGRLLDELLMPPLDAALALAQGHHAPERVGEHLDLDVARPFQIFLEVHLPRPEGLQRLALRYLERRLELRLRLDQPHPFPPTPRHRLEQDGVAEARRFGAGLRVVRERPRRSGHDRHACRLHAAPRLGLVPHGADGGGRRSHECEPRFRDGLGERRPLGQEAVSRMDRLAAAVARGGDQLRRIEVGLGRGRGPERHGGVGGADVRRETVHLRVHRDRFHPFFVACPDDAQGDLAAVGDEHARDRRHPLFVLRRPLAPRGRRMTVDG